MPSRLSDLVSSVTWLVTGGSGQVACALAGHGVHVVGRPEFDFDRPEAIEPIFHAVAPELVINAAAYTAVDAAESNEIAALRANRDGPAILARLCALAEIPLIHLSTDYVFDGHKGAPYLETDPVGPLGIYGRSKLDGEQMVMAACPRAIILRTSWVYAATGKNFVRTMLSAATKTDRLRVVADQQGCPTSADDLASAILAIATRITRAGWKDSFAGIFHAAGTGATTWHGFATAIFAEAAKHGMSPPTVAPITTAEWPTPARRQMDSRLDCTKLKAVFGLCLPPWQDSLARVVETIFATRGR
ncbi:MAG: dTDP-4-dehydrorhamnose reductase [Acetobacteraceae bacterium]|nr:dTDP-4-dehydrorhamnose reductase [Acetobacteraceae bacterium]MSP30710.1 dTDP-4-dehydrorhamnose reductase [Acetobacteraceae bacterium]